MAGRKRVSEAMLSGSGGFITQNPHETLSTPMKLLAPLSLLIQCHISIFFLWRHINKFNVHKTLMKYH